MLFVRFNPESLRGCPMASALTLYLSRRSRMPSVAAVYDRRNSWHRFNP